MDADAASLNANRLSLAVLAGGVALAFILPAAHFQASSMFSSNSGEASLLELVKDYPEQWVLWAAGFGLFLALASSNPKRSPMLRAELMSTGALTALILPIRTQMLISQGLSEARNNGYDASASLGAGLIVASIACVVAAAIPWWQRSRAGLAGSAARTLPARPFVPPPVVPAHTPALTLRPSTGQPGSPVVVALTGFPPGDNITVWWVDPEGSATELGGCVATTSGQGAYRFSVPESECAGERIVRSVASTGQPSSPRASATFTVLPRASDADGGAADEGRG